MSARLPVPGSDDNTWGTILNTFLEVAHNSDGSLLPAAIKNAGAVTSVNNHLPASGALSLGAADVGAAQSLTPTATKNSNYTAAPGELVLVDASNNNVTISLPVTPNDGSLVAVKVINIATPYVVTVAVGGSSTFNATSGVTSTKLDLTYQAITFQYASGQNTWYDEESNIPISGLDDRYVAKIADSLNVRDYGAAGDGVTNDTTAFTNAITALSSYKELYIPPGTYLVDGLVVEGKSHFRIRGGQGARIKLSSARADNPLVNTRTVLLVADSTDFEITDLEIDGNRHCDVTWPTTDHAPVTQYLTANAASGQSQVTVQNGATFVVGERVSVFGGLTANGGSEHNASDNNGGAGLTISGISGNVLTLSGTLTNSYTATGAAGGAYVTTYQTGTNLSVTGRTFGNENLQCGIHLVSCQRFVVTNNNVHDIWESPIKCGTGFMTTSLTDSCSYGTVANNVCRQGYDQGVSVWLSNHVSVATNSIQDPGWAGISFTNSWDCVAVGNVINSVYYRVPGDNSSGSGIATEGGGHHTITGNHLSELFSKGLNLAPSPLFSLDTTLTAAITPGTTGNIAVASSSSFTAGAVYTVYDGVRSEQITVSSIPDSTHISIGSATTKYWHNSGTHIGETSPEDITFTGNIIEDVYSGTGIEASTCARVIIGNNVFRGIENQALNVTVSGTPSSYAAGLVFESNTCTNCMLGGGGEFLLFDSVTEAHVVDNLITGAPGSGTIGIHLKGATDSIVANNRVTGATSAAIFLENSSSGSVISKRTTITGNYVARNHNEGVIVLNGDTLTIVGNVMTSNNASGISLRGVLHSIIKGNIVTSNGGGGIQLVDQSSTPCMYNRIEGNSVRNDSDGSYEGSTETQSQAISESGTANYNYIENNIVDVASVKVGANTVIVNELVG